MLIFAGAGIMGPLARWAGPNTTTPGERPGRQNGDGA
jgi:hypothetical protein